MLSRAVLKRLSTEDRNLVLQGGLFVAFLTGPIAYWNYRQYIRKDFYRSEGIYRFSTVTTNITPWTSLYYTWWRMPEEEFEAYHKFRPYYMLGQLDHAKEILIPKTRVFNGTKQEGYEVYNPLYCYEAGRISFKSMFEKKDPISVDRAAIIVNRGWIPLALKDKRSRPEE